MILLGTPVKLPRNYRDLAAWATALSRPQMDRLFRFYRDSNHEETRKREPLSEKRILRIMIQCMLALGYMHKNHVMHRDIKAANVFLHNTGTEFFQMDIVKLGDFGIAKVLEKTMDKANTVAGTPYYMSPEICKDQPYTLKSDVWSLGILLFELALLEVPFNASNLLGLVKKVVSMPPKRIPNTYSREFRQLGDAMLQKSP